MVRRLIKKQHVGLGQKQTAERDTALFTAGEVSDLCVPGRKTKRVGGDFHLGFRICAGRSDNGFQTGLLSG